MRNSEGREKSSPTIINRNSHCTTTGSIAAAWTARTANTARLMPPLSNDFPGTGGGPERGTGTGPIAGTCPPVELANGLDHFEDIETSVAQIRGAEILGFAERALQIAKGGVAFELAKHCGGSGNERRCKGGSPAARPSLTG